MAVLVVLVLVVVLVVRGRLKGGLRHLGDIGDLGAFPADRDGRGVVHAILFRDSQKVLLGLELGWVGSAK